jgi:hypothetical protein
MNRIEGPMFSPYRAPKHADLSSKALAECRDRDLQASITWCWQRHQPRHSTYVCKKRAA